MSNCDSPDDLPILRDDTLPVLLPLGPEHAQAAPTHQGWASIASQRQLRGIATGKDGSVWLATRGGVLHWHLGMERFTRYGSEHGLPGNSVATVAVDAAGQVWATSEGGGIFWLQGKEWRPCPALKDVRVAALVVDQAGRLWAAASEGLWVIERPSDATQIGANFGGLAPRGLAVMDRCDAWLWTAVGLHHLGLTGWEPPRPARGVLALAYQGESLWLGTAAGLQRLTQTEVVPTGRWPRGEVAVLAADTDGVWAAVRGKNGYEVGLATATGWIQVAGRPLRERVVGLAPAGPGSVWIATDDGLALGSTTSIRWYQTEGPPEVIPVESGHTVTLCNLVRALVVHRNTLWIGTARGLFRIGLADGRWHGFAAGDRLADIRAILPGTGADELWIATGQDGHGGAGGLRRVRRGVPSMEEFAVPASILGLAAKAEGARWAVASLDLGPLPDGLYRNNGDGWFLALAAAKLRAHGLPPGACLQAVCQAPDGRTWIGASAGLFAWQPNAAIESDLGLGQPDVRAILTLADGTVVIGTACALYAGSPGHLAPVADWAEQAVNALAWDASAKTLWCGTDAGLVQVGCTPAGWRVEAISTTTNSGLAANRVTALALSGEADGAKAVWAGTPNGISRYRFGI